MSSIISLFITFGLFSINGRAPLGFLEVIDAGSQPELSRIQSPFDNAEVIGSKNQFCYCPVGTGYG